MVEEGCCLTAASAGSGGAVRVRMSALLHRQLFEHLFPGDGLEAVAIVFCGRAGGGADEVLVAHELVPIPYAECPVRTPVRVTWKTESLVPFLERASRYGWALLKVHSHPTGGSFFSEWDDRADRELFPGVNAWLGDSRPHASAVMTPDGLVLVRTVDAEGAFHSVRSVTVVGSTIREIHPSSVRARGGSAETERTAQAFGAGTVARLASLAVAVVGCSGTGSWVAELLVRLGVGELVLIDPDVVEQVNLNRIVHSSTRDASDGTPKVHVISEAIRRTGLPVRVEAYPGDLLSPDLIRRVSRCDMVFGCVDTIDAREALCRLATYYVLPYFDVGVRLIADGAGGIEHIAGTAHYFHPNSPTLLERGVYSAKQLADAGLRRSDPSAYAEQVRVRYISGAEVARPAVASVNAFYASLAVNEMLDRIHTYRDSQDNAGVTISLSQLRVVEIPVGAASAGLQRRIGLGDAVPLLGLPMLSEGRS